MSQNVAHRFHDEPPPSPRRRIFQAIRVASVVLSFAMALWMLAR